MTAAAAAPPKGRRMLELLASSGLAQSLKSSYMAAVERQEKMAVKAQILSPFVASYTLRLFNECFDLNLNRY